VNGHSVLVIVAASLIVYCVVLSVNVSACRVEVLHLCVVVVSYFLQMSVNVVFRVGDLLKTVQISKWIVRCNWSVEHFWCLLVNVVVVWREIIEFLTTFVIILIKVALTDLLHLTILNCFPVLQ
jgi:hypothetical protein